MLENYLSVITNLENYVDGILVTDTNANVVYIRQYNPEMTPLREKDAVGKSLFEIYPEMSPEDSTIMKALNFGETTLNYKDTLTTSQGETFEIVDDTFPIRENGNIIGAVCITYSPTRRQAITSLQLSKEAVQAEKDLFTESDIIGRSASMQTLRNQIQRVSQTSSSILLYGETGSGKEMVAQSVHTASNRKKELFITQNCAAIPATLLESIFFGTVKGGFTGAEDRAGIFETANGGTVFLDEINSMDIALQAKLLRVLEEKKVTRIGSTASIPVDVRIIAAVNQKPFDCIKAGTLRPDLFYRLGSVTLDIPPLRERGGDLELLVEFFLEDYNVKMKKNIIGVSQDVMTIFRQYSWPGNVREFKNVIEGAFNLCDTPVIGIGDLPSYLLSGLEIDEIVADNQADLNDVQWLGSLKKNMEAYEKSIIISAIKSHASLSKAADYLGISRQSLNQKINKYNIQAGRQKLQD